MAQRKFRDDLAYPPRAMKADRAAAYLDISRSKFLELVAQGRLPKPKVIDGVKGEWFRKTSQLLAFIDEINCAGRTA